MRRISIPNPSVDVTYKTYLTADYSSGTTLSVASNTSFAANDQLVIGNLREELTELKLLSSNTNNTTMNLASALNFAHPKGTNIFKVPWDFVSIEGRSSSSGAFAELTQSPIQWDNEDGLTIYFHSAGSNTWEYRFRYYNSNSATYSEYSATVTGAIPSRKSVRYLIDMVRTIGGDTEGKIISDFELIRIFNRAQDIIYTHNPKYWFLKVDTFETGSDSISATAGEDKYSLANLDNFGELSGIKYRYNSGGTNEIYHLDRKDEVTFDKLDQDQNATNDDWPTIYKLLPADSSSANGYFKITPDISSNGVGTFYPVYFQKMPELDTVDDTTLVPLPDLLIDYGVGLLFRIKGNETKAKIYELSLVSDSENVTPKGLIMLDKMDKAQREAVGQPKLLWRFKGQKALSRLFGSHTISSSALDARRENYF